MEDIVPSQITLLVLLPSAANVCVTVFALKLLLGDSLSDFSDSF